MRIPFHPDKLIFWAFCDRCSSFFTGNTIWAHDRNMSRLTRNVARVRKDMRAMWHACDKTNVTEQVNSTCNVARMRKDMRAIWHACDKTNLTLSKLTQRVTGTRAIWHACDETNFTEQVNSTN